MALREPAATPPMSGVWPMLAANAMSLPSAKMGVITTMSFAWGQPLWYGWLAR